MSECVRELAQDLECVCSAYTTPQTQHAHIHTPLHSTYLSHIHASCLFEVAPECVHNAHVILLAACVDS